MHGIIADLLSVAEAPKPLFASTPRPSEDQPCAGCTPRVDVVDVSWDGQGHAL